MGAPRPRANLQGPRRAPKPGRRPKRRGRWAGSTVVCIASGPSLTQTDCDHVEAWREGAADRHVIAVNNSALTFGLWWIDVLYACDARWWREHWQAIVGFNGERWTLDQTLLGSAGIHQIDGVDLPGLSENPRRIHTGGNSGYQALGLAVLWGAPRIVLLGYDMQITGGRTHCHADHSEALGNPGDGEFARWRQRMTFAAADLRRLNVEVVNASRATALTCFERIAIEDALGG